MNNRRALTWAAEYLPRRVAEGKPLTPPEQLQLAALLAEIAHTLPDAPVATRRFAVIDGRKEPR